MRVRQAEPPGVRVRVQLLNSYAAGPGPGPGPKPTGLSRTRTRTRTPDRALVSSQGGLIGITTENEELLFHTVLT